MSDASTMYVIEACDAASSTLHEMDSKSSYEVAPLSKTFAELTTLWREFEEEMYSIVHESHPDQESWTAFNCSITIRKYHKRIHMLKSRMM